MGLAGCFGKAGTNAADIAENAALLPINFSKMHHPTILLHGALGSAALFEELIIQWPEEQDVYAWSFPGHGGQSLPAEFSIAAFADFVLQKMDEHNLSQCRILGYSMGGYVGLYLARHFPERVATVRTLGTKFDWTPETAAREVSRLDPLVMQAKVPAFADMLAARHAPGDWMELVRQTAGLLTMMGERPPLGMADWPLIQQAVHIGRGALDNMVSEAESRLVADALPNGQYVLLPDVKHPWEQVGVAQVAGYWLG